MKKIMIIVLTGVLTLVMSASVMAATSADGTKLSKRIETLAQRQARIEEIKIKNQEKQAKLESKKDEYNAFRQSLIDYRLKVLRNRETSLSVIDQNNETRQSMAQTLKGLRESGAALPEEAITQLKAYNAQIAEIKNALQETKGQIKETLTEYEGFIKEKDYAAMDSAYAEIAEIQSYRLELLNQINDILQNMNQLLDSSSQTSADH